MNGILCELPPEHHPHQQRLFLNYLHALSLDAIPAEQLLSVVVIYFH